MPVVVASAGGSGGAGRASSHRSSRPGAGRHRPGAIAPVFARVLGTAAECSALLSAAAGLTLVARRLSGAVAAPVGAGAVVSATVIGIGLVAFADLVRPRGFAARFAARFGLAMAMAALLPPLVGDGGSVAGRIGGILAIVAGSAALLLPLRDGTAHRRGRAVPRPAPRSAPVERSTSDRHRRDRDAGSPTGDGVFVPPDRSSTAGATGVPATASAAAVSPPAPLAARPAASPTPAPFLAAEPGTLLLQRFERVLEPADRSETVRATILLRVAAGSRSATGHVGFCPPFPHVPRVEAGTSCEEVEATVVAAEVLPWGVRVECRLDEAADESIDVPVDIVARSPSAADPPETASP